MGRWYWHVHHDVLCQPCDSASRRRREIRESKPGFVLRLRLLKPVRGLIPVSLRKLTRTDWNRFVIAASGSRFLKRLHKKECPRCPWNGITIFPRGERRKR